mmetsp:Transcript_1231/g.3769  ORF Transcript_1231/g.3769 Transcript_1231/m.3769 type:complete len:252 (+) Transcript_1231:385-1140(+)
MDGIVALHGEALQQGNSYASQKRFRCPALPHHTTSLGLHLEDIQIQKICSSAVGECECIVPHRVAGLESNVCLIGLAIQFHFSVGVSGLWVTNEILCRVHSHRKLTTEGQNCRGAVTFEAVIHFGEQDVTSNLFAGGCCLNSRIVLCFELAAPRRFMGFPSINHTAAHLQIRIEILLVPAIQIDFQGSALHVAHKICKLSIHVVRKLIFQLPKPCVHFQHRKLRLNRGRVLLVRKLQHSCRSIGIYADKNF